MNPSMATQLMEKTNIIFQRDFLLRRHSYRPNGIGFPENSHWEAIEIKGFNRIKVKKFHMAYEVNCEFIHIIVIIDRSYRFNQTPFAIDRNRYKAKIMAWTNYYKSIFLKLNLSTCLFLQKKW
jgi:hypothetical protein